MRSIFYMIGFILISIGYACTKQLATPTAVAGTQKKINSNFNLDALPGVGYFRGADVSGLSKMEDSGYVFHEAGGVAPVNCLQVLKDEGINSIRLRVWVDDNGYSGKKDVATMAQRAFNMGFKVMIDFHLSRTWADNKNQKIPNSWAPDIGNLTALGTDIYNHVHGMLDTLKTLGVTPTWVQMGNETDMGILNPVAQVSFTSASNYSTLATLLNRGYQAVKDIDNTIQVIIHLSDVSDTQARYYFDHLKSNGGKFDMIGFSVYPDTTNWQSHIPTDISKFQDMNTRYGLPVMACEFGLSKKAPLIARDGLTLLMDQSRSLASPGVAGAFYWEPEGYNSLGNAAFDATGHPLATMDAFLNDKNKETNLVSNFSFEADGAATQTPTGWTSVSLTGTYTADYTTASGFIGAYHLTHWLASAYQVSTHQIKTGLASGTYKLSAWVESSGGQTTCQLFAKDFGSAEQNVNVPTAANWTYIEVPGIVVSNGQCDLGLRSTSPGGNWCRLDDVAFYRTN